MLEKMVVALCLVGVAACKGGDKAESGKSSGKPRDMVAERAAMAKFRDQACACTDAACADKSRTTSRRS